MRNLKSIAGAVAFMVLWAGAALAMPTSLFSPDDEPSAVAELVEETELEAIEVEATPEGETVDVTVPDEKDEDSDDDGSDDGEARPDNHGKAVSTAAHCDLKGRAKGQLVSSVARDKSATVESAQAACDAAVAAAATDTASKPVKAAKPERAPKPAKASKPAPKPKPHHPEATEEVTEVEPTEAPAPESGPPAHAGPPADKGPKKP